jgi:ATP/maltotriose-dependent transcriptional regulator MalT
MTIILIAVLFILQLLSFYFLIILNTKLAKFKDLEKKQERLMREMDDTISVYLADMKDENDRLIQELQRVSKSEIQNAVKQSEKFVKQKDQEQPPALTKEESTVDGSVSLDNEPRVYVPKNIVANAYSRQQQTGAKAVANKTDAKVVHSAQQPIDATKKEEAKPLTIEQQVVELAKQGQTAEEIAKQLQKGKTEIELLLKFHY